MECQILLLPLSLNVEILLNYIAHLIYVHFAAYEIKVDAQFSRKVLIIAMKLFEHKQFCIIC